MTLLCHAQERAKQALCPIQGSVSKWWQHFPFRSSPGHVSGAQPRRRRPTIPASFSMLPPQLRARRLACARNRSSSTASPTPCHSVVAASIRLPISSPLLYRSTFYLLDLVSRSPVSLVFSIHSTPPRLQYIGTTTDSIPTPGRTLYTLAITIRTAPIESAESYGLRQSSQFVRAEKATSSRCRHCRLLPHPPSRPRPLPPLPLARSRATLMISRIALAAGIRA